MQRRSSLEEVLKTRKEKLLIISSYTRKEDASAQKKCVLKEKAKLPFEEVRRMKKH